MVKIQIKSGNKWTTQTNNKKNNEFTEKEYKQAKKIFGKKVRRKK